MSKDRKLEEIDNELFVDILQPALDGKAKNIEQAVINELVG